VRFDLVIKDGQVVDPPGGVSAANVGITAGKVAALLAPLIPVRGREEVDARGRYLFPGVIEPGVSSTADGRSPRPTSAAPRTSLHDGWTVRGGPVLTLVRGCAVARDHAVVGRPGKGRFVAR